MLKRPTENSYIRAPVVPSAVKHAKTVLGFIYDKIVLPYPVLLSVVSALGAFSRFLSLLSFVAAFKAVFVAIAADTYAAHLQKLLSRQGFDFAVSGGDVILITICVLIAITVLADVTRYVRFMGVSYLQDKVLADAVSKIDKVRLASDRFMVERVSPAIDTLVKLLEICLFSLLILVTIAFINLYIVLFLIPLFAMIAVPGLLAKRYRLRTVDKKKKALSAYQNQFPTKAQSPEDVRAWIDNERKEYLSASNAVKKYQLQSQRVSLLLIATGVIALVAYLPHTNFGSVKFLSIPLPIIFIVLALRQVLQQANEFAASLSNLLELRDGLETLEVRDEPAGSEETRPAPSGPA